MLQYAEVEQAQQQVQQRINTLEALLQSSHTEKSQSERNLERLRNSLKEIELGTTSEDILRLNLKTWTERLAAVQDLEARSNLARQQTQLEYSVLQRAIETDRAYESAAKAVRKLRLLQTVLHNNAAPRDVSYVHLRKLTEVINRTLEPFESPFVVEAQEDLSFLARFSDGVRVQHHQRLSVGQRAVLAICARIALNSRFVGQLGVLALDEPTADLDEHNQEALPVALVKLKELCRARNLQIFFVTHAERLVDLFDQVVEVAA